MVWLRSVGVSWMARSRIVSWSIIECESEVQDARLGLGRRGRQDLSEEKNGDRLRLPPCSCLSKSKGKNEEG